MPTLIRAATRVLAVASAAATVVALSACGGSASAPGVTADTVRIGTHAPASGPDRIVADAAKAYFSYVNAHGGINGRKIVYTIVDDEGTPDGAIDAVQRLVEKDHVFAIVGGTGSVTHAATLDYLTGQGVPDLFVLDGSAQWNDPESRPLTFGFDASYVVQAKVLSAWALQKSAVQPKCLLGVDGELGTAFAAGIADTLGPSALAAVRTVPRDPAAVAAPVAELRAAGCVDVFLATPTDLTAAAVAAAAAVNWHPTWLAASSGGESHAEGLVSTSEVPGGEGNRWITQFRVIHEKYGSGGSFDFDVALGMSMGYTFVEALTKTGGDPTRGGIVKTLESGRVTGAGLMPITYSRTNHVAYTGAGITQVTGGAQRYVGATYLAAAGGSQPIAYVGKGIPFVPDAIPPRP